MNRYLKAPILAALLALGFARPASADSWPTSFEFNPGVKLTVTGPGSTRTVQELKPYRGVTHSMDEARGIVKGALSAIGNKGTTLGEVYGIVQVVDSVAFNMDAEYKGRAKAVLGEFERGLKKLAVAGDGLNAQLGLAVHKIYSGMRTSNSMKEHVAVWTASPKGYSPRRELQKIQKVVKDPAVDLIVSALRNDVASRVSESAAGQKLARNMFYKSERDFAKAAAKVLYQDSAATPSMASKHTRNAVKSFIDYAQYFGTEMPLVAKIQRTIEDKSLRNPTKIGMIQADLNARANELGKRPVRLAGYNGPVVGMLPRRPQR
jgi:hypothetical protein